jgi:hypothetical protein
MQHTATLLCRSMDGPKEPAPGLKCDASVTAADDRLECAWIEIGVTILTNGWQMDGDGHWWCRHCSRARGLAFLWPVHALPRSRSAAWGFGAVPDLGHGGGLITCKPQLNS